MQPAVNTHTPSDSTPSATTAFPATTDPTRDGWLRELTAALSVPEKASLLSGRDFWSTQPVGRVGVPAVVMTDGPHGVRRQVAAVDHLGVNASSSATCFPPAVAVGSSWNPDVAHRVGAAVGREARQFGIGVILGPGVNIKRSPLCGRNFEYYSEDPLLAGLLGAAHVRGQQQQGVGAAVKHFAANNQETDRMRVSADVDERTLREIYLPAFERIVTDAAPAAVMCSYNKLNGVSASENRWLLTDVLRQQWGFAGAVVSDWGAVQDPVASVRAGLDLQMPGTSGRSARKLMDAVEAGELDEAVLDTAVQRVLALAHPTDLPAEPFEVDAHHALAREIATECAVLLKNNGVLPLPPAARLAVIGEFARNPRFQGGGSSHVNATRVDAPLDALRDAAPAHGYDISFAAGYGTTDTRDPDDKSDTAALLADAVAVAGGSDVAVVFAGLSEAEESEGFDRGGLELPAAQVELILRVAAAAPRTVVVLSNGGVVTMEGWLDDVDAVLEGFLLGQAGGSAVVDLLTGAANPSGRLAESIPVRLADTAAYLNFPGEQGHVRYGEGVMVGYRWHGSSDRPAQFPFGHGLSYTTFEVSDLRVDVTGADTARVAVTITNTGARTGGYVVQVYVATAAGPVRRPLRELRAFSKIVFPPGGSQLVELNLDRRAFAYWDIDQQEWVVAPGAYEVQVCQDAETVLAGEPVTLTGDTLVRELTLQSTVEEWYTHPVVGQSLLDMLSTAALPAGGVPVPTPQLLRMISSMPMQKVVDMLGGAVPAAVFDGLMSRSQNRQTTHCTGPQEQR